MNLERKRSTSPTYKLSDSVSSITRLSPLHEAGLKRLKISTIHDLLRHFPTRYADVREIADTRSLTVGQLATIYGVMEKVKIKRSFRGHVPMTEARVADNTGTVRCIWFNQAYIGKMYPDGTRVKISGVIQKDSRGYLLSNPHIEKVTSAIPETDISLFAKEIDTEFLIPIYPETKGVTSNYLYTLIKKVVSGGILHTVEDPIPEHITKKLNLPKLKDALMYIHFPKNENLTIAARKRFAFEEIFYMQIKQYREKVEAKHFLAYPITTPKPTITSFIKSFPFTPTEAQMSAIDSILKDISLSDPMGRLLEGDVGSGKTFVAAVVAYAVLESRLHDKGQRLQVAYMAPTEILAKQHFDSFVEFFRHTNIEIGLLTGSGCKKFPSKTDGSPVSISRSQLSKWLEDGRISIVVGTHTLIQKSVRFANLALIIIDEQHRFGVKQRKALASKKGQSKKELPHLLSMTATPIPRTLALTLFGDLDITVIDTMPKDRKKIITEIIPNRNRKEVYERIRKELQAGRQMYVICPRIDEQDEDERQKRQLKSVKEEADKLAHEIFPEFVVDILHSKMKKEEKEEVMQDFLNKKSDILVSTSVVEVGMNVPNATVIIIEHADRFGLAQLHQLRGRVGRREHQSYCYLFSESYGESTRNRLKALVTAKNGFELAEHDMLARGIGTLMDGKQWGLSDLAMEAIKNPKLVEIAREEAKNLVNSDPSLEHSKLLQHIISEREKIHME